MAHQYHSRNALCFRFASDRTCACRISVQVDSTHFVKHWVWLDKHGHVSGSVVHASCPMQPTAVLGNISRHSATSIALVYVFVTSIVYRTIVPTINIICTKFKLKWLVLHSYNSFSWPQPNATSCPKNVTGSIQESSLLVACLFL